MLWAKPSESSATPRSRIDMLPDGLAARIMRARTPSGR